MIPLNVGGHNFVTTLSTLTKNQDSMLAAMFSGRHQLDTDSEGRYFIDRDGTYFKHILNFLRDSTKLPSANIALEVRKASRYVNARQGERGTKGIFLWRGEFGTSVGTLTPFVSHPIWGVRSLESMLITDEMLRRGTIT